jgi:hypothetical protein
VLGDGILRLLELAAELRVVAAEASNRLALCLFAVKGLGKGTLKSCDTLLLLLALEEHEVTIRLAAPTRVREGERVG